VPVGSISASQYVAKGGRGACWPALQMLAKEGSLLRRSYGGQAIPSPFTMSWLAGLPPIRFPQRIIQTMDIKKIVATFGLFLGVLVLVFLPLGIALLLLLSLAGKRSKTHKTISGGILFGLLILFLFFIISFYTNAKVVGEFDNGGTWVADKSLLTAAETFFLYPAYFIASFFGYDSNTTYGSNNSERLLMVGTSVSALIVLSGVPLSKNLKKTK